MERIARFNPLVEHIGRGDIEPLVLDCVPRDTQDLHAPIGKLDHILLEGLDSPGCRVLSGPFPAGIEPNDPLGYAYDQTIVPRRYEPRLAKLLMTMNTNQMKSLADRKKEKVPEMKPIRLAFPADNLSRVACEAILSQWQLLGLEVDLVQLPIGRTFPQEGEADIV